MGALEKRRAIHVSLTVIALAGVLATLQPSLVHGQDPPPPAAAAPASQPETAPPTVAAPTAEPDVAPAPAIDPTGSADRPWRAGMERAPEPASVEGPLRWYGWQTLVVDLVSIASFAAGVSDTDLSVLTLVGMGGIVFGSPLVHVLNGNGSSAGISLGIRLGSFLLIGIAAILAVGETFNSRNGSDTGTVLAIGGLAGLAVGMIVDAAALAWQRDKQTTETLLTNTASIQPWLDPAHRRAGLSFVLTL